jgi:hypothetical protein
VAAKAMIAVENAAIRSSCLESNCLSSVLLTWPAGWVEHLRNPSHGFGFGLMVTVFSSS